MSTGAESLQAVAPGKVNLFLEVLGRRENGYHDIRSVVVPVSLYDTVRLELNGQGIHTEVAVAGVPLADLEGLPSEDNLATRAARALKDFTGYRGGAVIRVRKSIPVGGGLGGGSADAAAVLVGLNRLWQTGVGRSDLMELGASVGCDIPALIHGGPVEVAGLGEQVSAVPLGRCGGAGGSGVEGDGRWWLVLVNPGFKVSTRDVYARCSGRLTSDCGPVSNVLSGLSDGDIDRVAASLFNGLQDTVFHKYPLIEIIGERLMAAGAVAVLLCGSGGSVFGLARDEAHAAEVRRRFMAGADFPVWCRTVYLLPDGVTAAHGPLEA